MIRLKKAVAARRLEKGHRIYQWRSFSDTPFFRWKNLKFR